MFVFSEFLFSRIELRKNTIVVRFGVCRDKGGGAHLVMHANQSSRAARAIFLLARRSPNHSDNIIGDHLNPFLVEIAERVQLRRKREKHLRGKSNSRFWLNRTDNRRRLAQALRPCLIQSSELQT